MVSRIIIYKNHEKEASGRKKASEMQYDFISRDFILGCLKNDQKRCVKLSVINCGK